MDRYVEARARFPRAAFHYVGHSNGTYLAAQALRDYPAARFEHIVFMGSVVRRDYDWKSLIAPTDSRLGRVGKVLNYVATADWVVAIFPKGLQSVAWFNLGSAGHDGFVQADKHGPVYDVRYIKGSHSAGHEEPHWREIARFVVLGEPPPAIYPPLSPRQNRLHRFLGWISPGIVALVAAALAGVGALLLEHILSGPATPRDAAGLTAAFALYALLVYVVATRF